MSISVLLLGQRDEGWCFFAIFGYVQLIVMWLSIICANVRHKKNLKLPVVCSFIEYCCDLGSRD